jgi:predicted nucleic acid-binding protein
MMREVLLDANMLIAAFDCDETNEIEIQRRKRVEELASDPEIRFRITPLIYYEALRGVRRKLPADMEADLRTFNQIEIRGVHGQRAAELFRLAKDKGEWLDKRSFDLFHCVCADVDGLEFVSDDDKDIPRIKQLISRQ